MNAIKLDGNTFWELFLSLNYVTADAAITRFLLEAGSCFDVIKIAAKYLNQRSRWLPSISNHLFLTDTKTTPPLHRSSDIGVGGVRKNFFANFHRNGHSFSVPLIYPHSEHHSTSSLLCITVHSNPMQPCAVHCVGCDRHRYRERRFKAPFEKEPQGWVIYGSRRRDRMRCAWWCLQMKSWYYWWQN